MGIIFFGYFWNCWKNRVLNFSSEFQNFTKWIQLFFRLWFVSKLFHGQFRMTQSKGLTWAVLRLGCPTKVHFQFKPMTGKFDLWLSKRRNLPSSKSVLELTQAMNSGKYQIFETDLSFVQLRRDCVHFLFIRSKIDILLNATPDKVWTPIIRSVQGRLDRAPKYEFVKTPRPGTRYDVVRGTALLKKYDLDLYKYDWKLN